jgi:ankyrin repeat protein
MQNNVEALEALLATKACNIDALYKHCGSALHYAVLENDIACINLLMKHNANIYSKNEACYNETPIHWAAQNENINALARLCAVPGCQIDIKDCEGKVPLWYAVNNKSVACMHYLLDKKADISIRDISGSTLLHVAVLAKSNPCFPQLLPKMANMVNCRNDKDETPLHVAAQHGHIDFVEQLISSGALINKFHGQGGTPVHYAAFNGHVEIVMALLRQRADIESARKSF